MDVWKYHIQSRELCFVDNDAVMKAHTLEASIPPSRVCMPPPSYCYSMFWLPGEDYTGYQSKTIQPCESLCARWCQPQCASNTAYPAFVLPVFVLHLIRTLIQRFDNLCALSPQAPVCNRNDFYAEANLPALVFRTLAALPCQQLSVW